MTVHRPGTHKSRFVALAVGALVASGLSIAATTLDSVPSFDVMRSRLELTSEQARLISPLLERRQSELLETRARLDSATSRAEWQTALREAQAEGDAFSAEVEKVLSTSQVPEWRELRKELREKIRDRYEEDREAG